MKDAMGFEIVDAPTDVDEMGFKLANVDEMGFEVVGVDETVPPKYGTQLRAPTQSDIAEMQRKRIREALSPLIGYTDEQKARQIEGVATRGLMDAKSSIAIPRIGQQDTLPKQIAAGAANAGAGLVEGLANPLLLIASASPLKPVQGLTSGYFAVDMASHIPQGVKATLDAIQRKDAQQAAEAGIGTIASALMARSAAKHALGTVPETAPAVELARQLDAAEVPADRMPWNNPIATPAPDAPKPYTVDPDTAPWINRAAAQARGEAEFPQQAPSIEALPAPTKGGEITDGRQTERQRQEGLLNAAVKPRQIEAPNVQQESTGAPARETITSREPAGPDERTGSGMQAEREQRPEQAPGQTPPTPAESQPFTRGQKKYARADAERPHDIIDEIEGSIGRFNPQLIEEAVPGWKAPSILRKFMSRDAVSADVAITALQREGLLGSKLDGTIDQFREAIESAAKARNEWRKRFYREEREMDTQGSQATQFQKKVIQGERPKAEADNVEQIAIDNLIRGDTFTVQNHKFKVKDLEFDEDGRTTSITVEDGPKFGVQRVPLEAPGVGSLFIDRGSVERKSRPPEQDPSDPFSEGFFDKPETIEEQRAREDALAAQEQRRAQQEEMARRQAAPLEGTRGDLGQQPLFAEDKTELFSPGFGPTRSHAAPPRAYPGGPIGEGPKPGQNSGFSVFPAEMPEAVEFAKNLLGGNYPKVVRKIGVIRGALGVFKAHGKDASIELLASTAELLPEARKMEIREQATEYARATSKTEAEFKAAYNEHLKILMEQALEQAKRQNPEIAMKVIYHEIGHVVDWIKDHMIQGRGNLFGHIAALKDYLRNTLPLDSKTPDRPITNAERSRMYREAEKQMADEVGPMQELVRKIVIEEPIYEQLKITPEDVKSMLGMEARERMPDLYEWFAKQEGKVKAEILKAAMKGMLDERLSQVAGKVQTGTRKVERTVRETVGRPPTKTEVQARFRELFEKEMQARRMVQLETVKAELEPLIAWWRGTEKMEKYFATGAEMYAEAFSVFMNNPAAMAERAPTSYALFRGWMDRRPEAMAEYNKIQDQIAAGTVMRERVTRLRDSWSRDADQSVKTWWDRKKSTASDVYDNVIYHFDREFGPVYRRATSPKLKEAIGNFLYRAAEHELFLGRVNTRVGGALKEANLDFQWLGEYMFHKRVAEERHSMFNPLGWTAKNSLERLAEMEGQLGPARFAQLEAAAQGFRKTYAEQVIPLMKQARMWSEELQAKIDSNVNYATFAAVRNLPDTGIQRELELSFGSSVTPHIYRQVGMLGEIKNPATATILKALSLMTSAHRNIAKRAIVEMMQRDAPTEIIPAEKRFNGSRWEPVIQETDRVGTIVLLNEGKVEAYYVPRAVADGINRGPAMQNRLQSAVINSLNHLKGVFTAYNIGFWAANFARDTGSFFISMPGTATPWYWAKNLPAAIKAARASVKGDLSNPIAEQMLQRKMVVARNDPRGVTGAAENEFDLKLASFGMDPVLWSGELTGVQKLAKAWHAYLGVGQTLERTQKAIGMMYLDEKFPKMPEWEKQEIVRENAGSPDFLQRGASNATIDFFMLFYNPWKQGIRAIADSAKRNPGQFGLKLATGLAVPTALMAAASSGALGKDAQEKYASIPDYDLSNYLCIPMGWADKAKQKVAYIRLPIPDTVKVAHAALFAALTGRGKGYMALMGGQLPGMNPIIDTVRAQGEYMMGQNPIDHHTGRPIMDSTTFKAGGWPAAQAMGQYTWNAFGGGALHRFQNISLDNPSTTPMEDILRAPVIANALGRWVKISNRGKFDADERNTKEIEQHRAQVRKAVETLMERWAESGILDGAPKDGQTMGTMAEMIARAELSQAERVLLREPYAMQHLADTLPDVMRARQDLLRQRLQRMPSKASKQEILRREMAPK